MKIALLTDGIYPYIVGGMQKHSYYLAKYLVNQGIDVDLYHFIPNYIARQPIDISAFFTPDEQAKIHFIQIDFTESVWFPGHYLYHSYFYSVNVYKVLSKNLQDIDFIYVQGFAGWKLFIEKTKQPKTLPPIGINFHGLEVFQKSASTKDFFSKFLLLNPIKYSIKKSDYIFSLGGKLTRILEKMKLNKVKIIEIPIGIDAKYFAHADLVKPNRTIKKFIFIGRFERRKGIQELNKALQAVSKLYQFEFHFVGDIPRHMQLNQPNITYHGILHNEYEVINLLQDTDVLVCPSYSEGMPTVILEAMANKCTIIATDVGAVQCLVNEHTGWLIAPGNICELKEAIINAIHTKNDDMKQKQNNAQTVVKNHYMWHWVIQQTVSTLQNIVKNHKENKSIS